jgi:hypothetical protein
MIDNAGIRAAVKAWRVNHRDCDSSTEDLCLQLTNAVAIIRDGKIVTDKPKVYARAQIASNSSEPCSILLDGLHVDLKICIEWSKTENAYDYKQQDYVRDKSGKHVTRAKPVKDPIFPSALTSIVVTEAYNGDDSDEDSDEDDFRPLKNPIPYPHICQIQILGLYPFCEWVQKYSEIIPEKDQIELAQKWQAMHDEYERLVPIQTALVKAKKLGNAKSKLANKRIKSLAESYMMNQWAKLGATVAHELITAFTKWEPRKCKNYDYNWSSPFEYFGFMLALGTEATERVFLLYSQAPGAVDGLHRWVQDARKSGDLVMSLEDVQEAFDLHTVKKVMGS